MTIRRLSLDQLQPLQELYYHMAGNDADLEAQLDAVGIVQPLIGVHTADGVGLLDGFRRYEWLARQEPRKVLVQVFPKGQMGRAFVSALSVNHWTRPLSIVEKARALRLARAHLGDEVGEEAARLLEVPPVRKIRQLLAWIDQLPAPARRWLHSARCSVRQVERLRAVKILESPCWLEAAESLNLKAQEFVNLAEQLWEIALRDGSSLDQLYQKLGVDALLGDRRTVQQKQQTLKQRIEETRFPLLKAIQQNVQQQLQQLPRPTGQTIRFTWDPTLERTGVGLQTWIASEADLERLQKLLGDWKFRSSLKQVLKNIQQIG
ncbi:MAG: hypothetical protein D6715_12120 [Calditrichaeota bacterium]|nr:MAG: hypothetical protein D6715_12120 [Calditrichota bacterium]